MIKCCSNCSGIGITKYSVFSECKIDEFAQALYSDLILRIDETIKDIIFLSDNSTMNKGDKNEVLKWYQFWEQEDISTETDDLEKIMQLYNNFKPRIQCKTINKWKIRAKKLLKEDNHSKVLEIWNEIDSQLLPLQTTIKYAVYSVEQFIDDQIDEAKLDKMVL
jgi:hypothetical protein